MTDFSKSTLSMWRHAAKSNCHQFAKQIIVDFRVRIWKNCSADGTYIHYIHTHTTMAGSSGSRKKSSIFWDTFVSGCGTLVSCPTSGAAEKKKNQTQMTDFNFVCTMLLRGRT